MDSLEKEAKFKIWFLHILTYIVGNPEIQKDGARGQWMYTMSIAQSLSLGSLGTKEAWTCIQNMANSPLSGFLPAFWNQIIL